MEAQLCSMVQQWVHKNPHHNFVLGYYNIRITPGYTMLCSADVFEYAEAAFIFSNNLSKSM